MMEEKMKKLITILAAGLAFMGAAFAEVPAFTDDSAYLVDSTLYSGEMKKDIVITNVSAVAANFNVTVFAYDESINGWTQFGQGLVKDLGDDAVVSSINKKLIKLENYKYFAIKTATDKPFKFSVAKDKNLHIWFYDDREIDESHCKVFTITDLPPFKDNLKIVGGENLRSAATFKVLVYNDEADEEKSGTIAILKGPKSSQSFSQTAKGQKYNLFKFIKIISREEKDFKYTANVAKNDLVITINNQ